MKLGLKNNWKQFALLVLINAFVGAMVGIERSVLPVLAEEKYHVLATSAILAFIITFGISKAIANYMMGRLAAKYGRKRMLVAGWVWAIPVPIILIYAPSWNWIIVANIFLGINQGLAWSSTVIMKIDLVGPKDRGLAMGINEFSGYLAVGLMALLTGWIANHYGIWPYPFYGSIAIVMLGLGLSIFFVKETTGFVAHEEQQSRIPILKHIFSETTLTNANLSSVTQAGLINNLNDGMVWGLLPILLASKMFDLEQIGWIVALYPAVWGISQLFTGKLADVISKKKILFWGMLLQGFALLGYIYSVSYGSFLLTSALLGVGTALVYPTFLASLADNLHPSQRAEGIGIFRLWRDLGYAIGAILSGLIADFFGISYSILTIAVLTMLSAMVIGVRMKKEQLNND